MPDGIPFDWIQLVIVAVIIGVAILRAIVQALRAPPGKSAKTARDRWKEMMRELEGDRGGARPFAPSERGANESPMRSPAAGQDASARRDAAATRAPTERRQPSPHREAPASRTARPVPPRPSRPAGAGRTGAGSAARGQSARRSRAQESASADGPASARTLRESDAGLGDFQLRADTLKAMTAMGDVDVSLLAGVRDPQSVRVRARSGIARGGAQGRVSMAAGTRGPLAGLTLRQAILAQSILGPPRMVSPWRTAAAPSATRRGETPRREPA